MFTKVHMSPFPSSFSTTFDRSVNAGCNIFFLSFPRVCQQRGSSHGGSVIEARTTLLSPRGLLKYGIFDRIGPNPSSSGGAVKVGDFLQV